jgi:hypothetical protein
LLGRFEASFVVAGDGVFGKCAVFFRKLAVQAVCDPIVVGSNGYVGGSKDECWGRASASVVVPVAEKEITEKRGESICDGPVVLGQAQILRVQRMRVTGAWPQRLIAYIVSLRPELRYFPIGSLVLSSSP